MTTETHMYSYGDADGNEHQFECDGIPSDCRICYPENAPSNARLIAAAPDLLAALERAADTLDTALDPANIDEEAVKEAIAEALAAIAAAKGDA